MVEGFDQSGIVQLDEEEFDEDGFDWSILDPIFFNLSEENRVNLLRRLRMKPSDEEYADFWNGVKIHDYLISNGYEPRNEDVTYDSINEFINSNMEPYYDEKRTNEDEDYEDEMKKLEQMK